MGQFPFCEKYVQIWAVKKSDKKAKMLEFVVLVAEYFSKSLIIYLTQNDINHLRPRPSKVTVFFPVHIKIEKYSFDFRWNHKNELRRCQNIKMSKYKDVK
jgi:hypothetical protein